MVREQRPKLPWYYVDALETLKNAADPMAPNEVMDAVYGFHEYRASFPAQVVKYLESEGLVTRAADRTARISAAGRTRQLEEDTSEKAPVRR